ncbi:MAG: M20/M25/M40 family metallo-hydrolase [Bacteroidales bacterium]|nr:M20/M25/M40 family metallo-hydrolase [Bacteroidales bacterium]
MKKNLFFILFLVPLVFQVHAQQDKARIKAVFDEALTSYESYSNLKWLCENTAGRICGTPEAAAAVEYTYQLMLEMDLDTVWKQECMVRNWKRGRPELSKIVSGVYGTTEVPVCALGLSIGTGESGISARLIEVMDFKELEKMKDDIPGRIVFFNRPMDQKRIATFSAYGGAANQRTSGPALAAKYGAVACVVRSLSSESDDYPHTGVTRFDPDGRQIPAFAISTNGADLLSAQLKSDPDIRLWLMSTCQTYPDVPSYNVIGEILGTEFPDEIITIGGHLDAWDIGEGAHDDGGGCMQAIEVLRLFDATGIRPKHTIRAVMFMDEEVAQRGGKAYADAAIEKGEKHIAAMESDRGVLTPRSVTIGTDPVRFEKALQWENLFKPYDLKIVKGGGGVDISPLRKVNPDLVYLGMLPDAQRYFRFHHSAFDTFEQVDRREMQMGAAAMAALVYLYDKYGL